ncbi:hypothetical protein PENSPDRAFT_17845 [Peniophora sp. CONT]|nr:hypothetical protein PENSPDRAFT_17845 [Peniophora sp. CONT]
MRHKPNVEDSVFNSSPQPAGAVGSGPLGESIRLRIDLVWCRRLPDFETSSDGSTTRMSYQVDFIATTGRDESNRVSSSLAQAGARLPRGRVQWDEILYLECFERSIIRAEIFTSMPRYLGTAYCSAADLLTRSEVKFIDEIGTDCTLRLSASTIHVLNDDAAECGHSMQTGSNLKVRVDPGITPGRPIACIANSLHVIMSQLSLLTEVFEQINAPFDVTSINCNAYYAQRKAYTAYRASLIHQACHPRVTRLIASMVPVMDVILPRASTYLKRRAEYIDEFMNQIF